VIGNVALLALILSGRGNPTKWARADWIDATIATGAISGLMAMHGSLGWASCYFRGRDVRRDREDSCAGGRSTQWPVRRSVTCNFFW
jgi:hypothetical protein